MRSDDLPKAYDSVDRKPLCEVLTRFGLLPEMVAVTRGFHEGMLARVRTGAKHAELFGVVQGPPQ